jgi:hypothetical protein
MKHYIPLGIYRHYKGQYYSVVGFAKHSETHEIMVLYVPHYGEAAFWVRPLAMFLESVTVDDKVYPRFEYIVDSADQS